MISEQDSPRQRSTIAVELIVIVALGIGVFLVAAKYDLLELLVRLSDRNEDWELDELLTMGVYFAFALSLFSLRRWLEVRHSESLLKKKNQELQKAFDEIEQLQGILPICAKCKNIRDDKGYWHQVEAYIAEHTPAEFSHSICPKCAKQLYPEIVDRERTRPNPGRPDSA